MPEWSLGIEEEDTTTIHLGTKGVGPCECPPILPLGRHLGNVLLLPFESLITGHAMSVLYPSLLNLSLSENSICRQPRAL